MAGTTNQLVAWCEAALQERRIFDAREYDAVVATGEQVTAGLLAIALQDLDINARSWQGWQLPILTSRRARLGAHPRHQRRRTDPAFQGAQGGRGDRRLPGRAQGHRPHHHARPRRLGHLGGRDRRRDPRRPLRHLYRRRRRLHHRSARRAARPAAGQGRVRGNAGARLARRQGDAGPLGRARHGAQCAHFRALELRPAGGHRPARQSARHADLRRGGDHGAANRHRHRLLARRGANLDPPGPGQAGRRRRHFRAARREPISMST